MKTLSMPIAVATLALLLGGCGSNNNNDGGNASGAGSGGEFVATVRNTLTQAADAEPNTVDSIANSPNDSAEPETL